MAILEESCNLEHLVVSVRRPADLREPLNVGKVALWDIATKERRRALWEPKDDVDLGNRASWNPGYYLAHDLGREATDL